ncbi:uncharacterized protein PG998_002516 [Apiospora kogelbergensis]|uniref:uncharacterized protein n=1 Tax=Apiospora kogelbergensis TaxID=1337665 RepID=UPI003131E2F0
MVQALALLHGYGKHTTQLYDLAALAQPAVGNGWASYLRYHRQGGRLIILGNPSEVGSGGWRTFTTIWVEALAVDEIAPSQFGNWLQTEGTTQIRTMLLQCALTLHYLYWAAE